MKVCVRKLALVCVCLLLAAPLFGGGSSPTIHQGEPLVAPLRTRPFPVAYADWFFAPAIEAAAKIEPASYTVSGLIVPHHLLAADLIARGFALARRGEYRRIVILSPDHFNRARTAFSVPGRDFLTSRGMVRLDREGADLLLRNPLVSESNLFSHEHGVQALLPFVVHHFPGALVLPVAVGRDSTPDEWRSFARSLAPLFCRKTLIVQSTDFSHYLDREETAKHDIESLAVLLSSDPERALSLRQPDHIDSRGALFIQMTLQRDRGASPAIHAHSTSFDYAPEEAERLGGTSYIVAVYHGDGESVF